MPATTEAAASGTGATSARLNFETIDARLAHMAGCSADDITDQMRAELTGFGHRTTWWRYRSGGGTPTLDNALDIAKALGLPIEEITTPKGASR